MRRLHCLTQRELGYAEAAVRMACLQNGVNPLDEEYRAAAQAAFCEAFRGCGPFWDGDIFWPQAFSLMSRAIRREKRLRSAYLYEMLSLDMPLGEDRAPSLGTLLPIQGDFTNGVAYRDYIGRLPRDLYRLARRLEEGDTLEEARSGLDWDQERLCRAVERLRRHMEAYLQM